MAVFKVPWLKSSDEAMHKRSTTGYLKVSGNQGDLSDLQSLEAMSQLLGCIDKTETMLATRGGGRVGEGEKRAGCFKGRL